MDIKVFALFFRLIGATVDFEKRSETNISMYLQKFGFDTAENEP